MGDFNVAQKSDREEFDKDRFQKMVAERAYGKFEKRGLADGYEIEDWLEAESEVRNQYFYWFQDAE